MKHCPHCQQPVTVRLGVQLTRKQAELFDLVERWPGISRRRLAELLELRNAKTASVHVNHINDMLVSTDWHIAGKPYHGYRLMKCVERGEAA